MSFPPSKSPPPLLLLLLVLHGSDGSSLLVESLLSAVAHVAVSQTAGLHLVGEVLGAGLLGLGLVNVLHQDSLVLEDITLRLEVQLVVAGWREGQG